MALEIIDGTLEPGTPKSQKFGYAHFAELTITTTTGERRSFAKVATGGAVTAEVLKGGPGRFSFYRPSGALALVGVQRPDGSRLFSWFTNVQTIALVVGALGTVLAAARVFFGVAAVPGLIVLFGPITLALAIYMLRQKQTTKAEFEADAG